MISKIHSEINWPLAPMVSWWCRWPWNETFEWTAHFFFITFFCLKQVHLLPFCGTLNNDFQMKTGHESEIHVNVNSKPDSKSHFGLALWFNHFLSSQNRIWMKYHFWTKNDSEKWYRKNIFANSSMRKPFLNNSSYFIERRILLKIANSGTNS